MAGRLARVPSHAPRWTIRRGPGSTYRKLKSVQFLLTRDRAAAWRFACEEGLGGTSWFERARLVGRFVRATNAVRGYHTLAELLTVSREVLARAGTPGLTVVEVGCAQGGATVKLSLVARRAGGHLHAFDTFSGMPPNEESHVTLDGRRLEFREGAFRATVGAVRRRLEAHGAPEACTLHRGRIEHTLAALDGPVHVAFVDVDLIASTRAALRELVPRLARDGVLFSHDGHLRATRDLLATPEFWRDEVGIVPPHVVGLGTEKLVRISPA